MKYCLKKKEKFVKVVCGKGVQLAYSKKYNPNLTLSFLDLGMLHVADSVQKQKMTGIEIWGALDEQNPKKDSLKLINEDFVKWWRYIQKNGGTEPEIPEFFYDNKAKDMSIVSKLNLEACEKDLPRSNPHKFTDLEISVNKEYVNRIVQNKELSQDPAKKVKIRPVKEENVSINPTSFGMNNSYQVSENRRQLQKVLDSANFASTKENVGMMDSIENIADGDLTQRMPQTDYIDAMEALKVLYNADDRIQKQKDSVLYRSQRVSRALTDCAHYEALVGIADDDKKAQIKMERLMHGLFEMRNLLKTEYAALETLELCLSGKNVDSIVDQLETRGYKPREFVNMFKTGEIPDFKTWCEAL